MQLQIAISYELSAALRGVGNGWFGWFVGKCVVIGKNMLFLRFKNMFI